MSKTDHSASPDHRPDFWLPNTPTRSTRHDDNVWDSYGIGRRYDTPQRTRQTLLGLVLAPVILVAGALVLYALFAGGAVVLQQLFH